MCSFRYDADPEPEEQVPAGPLYVPVRPGGAEVVVRLFRTPPGARTVVGFTDPGRLAATLGVQQPWIRLSESVLSAMTEPLGLYAAKAFLSRAMVRRVDEEGLGLAVTAGFPPGRIVLHSKAKSPRGLEAALRLGVGRIVIDSPSEIERIAAAVGPGGRQKVMVRVVPGVAAGGHDKIRADLIDPTDPAACPSTVGRRARSASLR
ncbi:hypothetical protein Slala05_04960 [Streptomyces lavendulae subsp. lavendulae]|nr:hypothetical protein Slala05_04960 [Streptomyces lavendulae subsp. lavendulae]